MTGALLVIGACLQAFAQPATPQYKLQDDPPTGSAIRRNVTNQGRIAINKTYAELTPEEKQILNENYESMGPGDEPPFPAEGLKPLYSAIAKIQQKLLVTGELYLTATVDAQGNVTQIKAMGNPDPEMTKAAATVLSMTRFKPALCRGVPCRMDYPVRFRFNVD